MVFAPQKGPRVSIPACIGIPTWKRFRFILLSVAVAVSAFQPGQARAASHHLILSGSGGEEAYQKRFRDWSARLDKALTEQLSIPAENVTRLAEPLEGPFEAVTAISLETIHQALENLAERVQPHGSADVRIDGAGFQRRTRHDQPGPANSTNRASVQT